MRSKSSIAIMGLFATALAAQDLPPNPSPLFMPGAGPQNQSAMREIWKQFGAPAAPAQPLVCSIPLLRVPLPANLEEMPHVAPDIIDRMPRVKLPAPPCQEDQR